MLVAAAIHLHVGARASHVDGVRLVRRLVVRSHLGGVERLHSHIIQLARLHFLASGQLLLQKHHHRALIELLKYGIKIAMMNVTKFVVPKGAYRVKN